MYERSQLTGAADERLCCRRRRAPPPPFLSSSCKPSFRLLDFLPRHKVQEDEKIKKEQKAAARTRAGRKKAELKRMTERLVSQSHHSNSRLRTTNSTLKTAATLTTTKRLCKNVLRGRCETIRECLPCKCSLVLTQVKFVPVMKRASCPSELHWSLWSAPAEVVLEQLCLERNILRD